MAVGGVGAVVATTAAVKGTADLRWAWELGQTMTLLGVSGFLSSMHSGGMALDDAFEAGRRVGYRQGRRRNNLTVVPFDHHDRAG